ncbi:MAG: hypothetical protein JWN40_667 [Phycisphaerales bacterium]|nr:hypothetical protein [Phycisphaerales bacterium]
MFALLIAGVVCWIYLGKFGTGGARALISMTIAVAVGVVLMLIRPARDAIEKVLAGIRNPSQRTRAIIAAILGLLAGIYFVQTALSQERHFGPVLHDEHCYIIQTRMLAQGKLWLPRHELADFFDSFHLITDRVYASKYGPGTALFGVPAVWAGLEPWVAPLALTSISVGLFYLVLAEMTDGLVALLGALMLPALGVVRRVSLEVLSEAPMLFLALLAVWAFLQWRRQKLTRWLALMSAAVGWGAVTRPADAVCLALPLAIGVAIELRSATMKQWAKTLAIGFLAAAPFLVLQLACNKGITGRWAELPWTYYGDRNDPYDSISYAPFDPARHTVSVVPEIIKFQDEFTRPAYQEKLATQMLRRSVEHSLKPTVEVTLPNPLLIVLAPVGLIGLFTRGRWVFVGALLLFIMLYARHTFFLVHYAVVIAPALIVLVLLGWEGLVSVLPVAARRGGQMIGALLIAGLMIAAYPQFQASPAADEWAFAPILRLIDTRLSDLGRKPAIVLFRFDIANGNPHIEPVYNTAAAWPDNSLVIRAHDLGPTRNRQLFEYYARQKPDRALYLFDLSPATIAEPPVYLGTASQLASQPPSP